MIYQVPEGSKAATQRNRPPHYDVLVVGARAAGAATAMLLARGGAKVLVIDRAEYGSDTLSTHALLRDGVDHLKRWGLLDKVAATDTPPVERTVFEYQGEPVVVDHRDRPLYAPRRTVLDPLLVDEARAAGATFCFGTRLVGVLRDDDGHVCGARVEGLNGQTHQVRADLLVGADGLRSSVARAVDAPVTHRGEHFTASIYAYLRGADLPAHDYVFAYGNGISAASIPTTDGTHCIGVNMSPKDFRSGVQLDVAAALLRSLDRVSPTLAAGARSGTIVGPFRSFPGHPGQFRAAHGPGWALVGDAGFFKDPAAAHGLSDAFRDAELLADAFLRHDMDRYEQLRDNLSMPLFNHIERLATLDWTVTEAKQITFDLGVAMKQASAALAASRNA